jgi:hypothetical protein
VSPSSISCRRTSSSPAEREPLARAIGDGGLDREYVHGTLERRLYVCGHRANDGASSPSRVRPVAS